MGKKKQTARDYKFPDADLIEISQEVASSVVRDLAEFASRNVTQDTVDDFLELVDNFDNYPTDEEFQQIASSATEAKGAARKIVIPLIRTIRSMAENVYGTRDAKYKAFGFEGLDNQTDNALHRTAKRIIRLATTHLSELAPEGLTQAKIDILADKDSEFDDAIDAQNNAEKDRDIGTEIRINKGNAVYKVLIRFCSIGKDLWYLINDAKYNDYVLYPSSGGSETPAPTPPNP